MFFLRDLASGFRLLLNGSIYNPPHPPLKKGGEINPRLITPLDNSLSIHRRIEDAAAENKDF
jgi:hypothetical protein